MKKRFTLKNHIIALIALLCLLCFTLVGCSLTIEGADGKDGKDGVNGINGTNGKDGVDGKDGAKWYCGVDYPTIEGIDGDFYVDTDDYILYQKQSGSWIIVMQNFGKPGKDGINGTNGINGVDGKDGHSIYVGYDGYVWQDDYKTDFKLNKDNTDLEDVVEDTIGAYTTMKYFKGNFVDLSSKQIALMAYYKPNAKITQYSGSVVSQIQVVSENSGDLYIGMAKVDNVVDARLNGNICESKMIAYGVVAGVNTIDLALTVEDDETIIIGGNNSSAKIYIVNIPQNDEQGNFSLIDGKSNQEVLLKTNEYADTIAIRVRAESDMMIENEKATWDEHLDIITEKENDAVLKEKILKQALKGKQLSVLGDSISTFIGVSNNAQENLSDNAVHYTTQMSLTDTYWQQVIDAYGMELCVNNSWSGAYVSKHRPNVNADKDSDGSVSSGIARANKLTKSDGTIPDYILVYIGINDLNAGVSVDIVAPAYEQMLKTITNTYSNAKVFCLNMPNRNIGNSPIAYNTAIVNAIEAVNANNNKENVFLVDLYNSDLCGATYQTCSFDNLHPNAMGMDYMTDIFVKAMKESLTKSYSVSAKAYQNLQKFAYFADENGKVVSRENPYTYKAEDEKTLTAVYEDFVDVKVQVNTSGTSAFEGGKYTSVNWFDLGYLTEPLKQGMSVSFDFVSSGQTLFGVSPLERIENSENYGWGTSYTKLFVPEINYYSSVEETSFELYCLSNNSQGGKTPYEYASLGKGQHSAKIVMADKVLIYVDNVLVNGDGKEYDTSKEYYLSLSGSGPVYEITEFGLDKDSKQVFVSEPVEASTFVGKKISFLGDSITAGDGSGFSSRAERFSSVLCTELSAVENNMGISGTVLCTGHTSRASRLADVDKIAIDSDYVFVMLGTNDFDNASTSFAELGKKGTTDTSTVYGAIDELCKRLVARFGDTNAKVYLVTPIPTQNSLDSTKQCANGWSLRDWSNILCDTAKEYGLNYIDLNSEAKLESTDMANNLHPNTSGTAKMVAVLKAHLLANESYYIPHEIL